MRFATHLRNWARGRSRLAIAALAVLAAFGACGTGVALEAVVRARLNDRTLGATTRFYARPVILQPGARADRARVEAVLERQGYRRSRSRRVALGEYRIRSSEWVVGRRAVRLGEQWEPGLVATVRFGWDDRVQQIRDEDDRELGGLLLEPEVLRTVARDGEDRVPIPLAQAPAHLVNAVLAIEDQRFHEHGGLDLRRIVGATLANVRSGGVVQGASTLTQQLAKNLFLSPRRSVTRKVREAAMAVVLEGRHSKDEILEAYLNEVYLGQDGALAIHGVGRAAQHFFGKDVTQLDLAESALLAGIIRGPSLYAPRRHPERARARRDLVLDVMLDLEMISEDDHRRARRAPLGVRPPPARVDGGRYFIDYVTRSLRDAHGDDVLRRGLAVFTTLDVDLQRAAERAVREGLAELERGAPYLRQGEAPLQGALVALDPTTGQILAMVGGRDYGGSQYNRVVDARRQPGSAFKPIVALTALAPGDDGQPAFTLASRLEDEPLAVETPAGTWQPANYDGHFRGEISLREALERSLNVPFARLGLAVGPERIVRMARALGIESRLPAVPSLAIGSADLSPLEMTRAFGVLAAGGYRAPLNATIGVLSREGDLLERIDTDGESVLGAAEAYLVTSALEGAVERGTGRALRRRGFRGAVAAKSGTTNDFRDAWFIGYTPTLAIGVWVGFDDGSTIGLPGSRAALPIFARFLLDAVGRNGEGQFERPFGIELVDVDPSTGLRGGPGCWGEPEAFLRGTAPEQSCSSRWHSTWDVRRGIRVDEGSLLDDLRRLIRGGGR
jgi:penicillin-binding protein 1B